MPDAATITNNLQQVRQTIADAAGRAGRQPASVTLLAVSKTRPAMDIETAFAAGQSEFGENYLQEALEKIQQLAHLPLNWHFIGRIQSNKTRQIAEHFSWVHTLDSAKHARRLSEQRPVGLPPINACIQVNVSDEQSKGGISPGQLNELADTLEQLPGIRLRGLMAIPAASEDQQVQHSAFRQLADMLQQLRERGLAVDTLSMGMSGDLVAAIEEGATMVRIGTAIFGPRQT